MPYSELPDSSLPRGDGPKKVEQIAIWWYEHKFRRRLKLSEDGRAWFHVDFCSFSIDPSALDNAASAEDFVAIMETEYAIARITQHGH